MIRMERKKVQLLFAGLPFLLKMPFSNSQFYLPFFPYFLHVVIQPACTECGLVPDPVPRDEDTAKNRTDKFLSSWSTHLNREMDN